MKSQITRRDFLKVSGGAAGVLAATGVFGGALKPEAVLIDDRPRWVKETFTICPYDASGCGFICFTDSAGRLVNLEGDPDHPINRGSACSKGAAMAQLHNNSRRLNKVLYRAPGAADWEEKSWDFALDKIARNIKDTRDADFIETDDNGFVVNRNEAVAHLGGAANDNEECYLFVKMARALGMVYIEHQARI